jgi:two-component system, cell cycle response regulator DivK
MKTLLLVEDNELNRDMLSRRLERRGYRIVCALDGQEAVEMAAAENPDLILMDMDLPVVNGWDATRTIRSNPALAATPVIALTAHALPTDRDKALQAGCDDYQSKPIEFAELLQKIEQLIERRVKQ